MSDDMPRTVSVSDQEILDSFSKSKGPIATVSDLEEQLPIQSDSIRVRLKQLEGEGVVRSKKVGARAVVWWRVD